MFEIKWNEYMHPLLNSMEEVSRSDHHPECYCLGLMDTNCASIFFVNHTWAWNDGVNTYPSWHGVTERTDTPPLSKEVCLTGSHVNLTFTSIEVSPEKCGTFLDASSK